MFAIGILLQEQTVGFYKQQQQKLNQDTPDLWNKIIQEVRS